MIELNKIYNEDCLTTLSKIEDDTIDIIITSPPYNKGYYSTATKGKADVWNKTIDYGEFGDCMTPDDYVNWQKKVLDECVRVIKPNGSIWYNHMDILAKNRCIHPTYVWEYPVKQMIIWDRGKTPKISSSFFYPTCEYLFWIGKEETTRPYFDKSKADYNKMVWNISPKKNTEHPAPFPMEIPLNIIKCCSKENDIVYDPFMGSGTTAKAAKQLNRCYIGSEINKDYINNAI